MTDTSTPPIPPAKPKWFLQSKTIWGVIVMAVPMVLPMIGINLGADGAALISSAGDQVLQAIGTGLVLYARFKDGSTLTATPAS
jgi:hypothetical protein